MVIAGFNKLPQRGAALMSALADSTRKTIFNMLLENPLVVKVIAADLPISQSAVSQHLKVMKEAGLVIEEKKGRSHWYSVNPVALDWLSWQFGLLRDDILQSEDNPIESNNPKEYDAIDMAMEQWTQQWSELDTLANGVMLRICLLGRHLEWLFERLAIRFDMTATQVMILSTLDRIPGRQCSVSELTKYSFTKPSIADNNIEVLIDHGYVECLSNPENGNSIKMTETGKDVIHKILAAQRNNEHAPIYQMNPENRLKLAKLLRPLLYDVQQTMKGEQ